MSYAQQKETWLAQNPLRQWRTGLGLSLDDVGKAVSAGYHTVYRWEKGMSRPSIMQGNALEELTGIANLQRKLEDWSRLRPVFGKEK